MSATPRLQGLIGGLTGSRHLDSGIWLGVFSSLCIGGHVIMTFAAPDVVLSGYDSLCETAIMMLGGIIGASSTRHISSGGNEGSTIEVAGDMHGDVLANDIAMRGEP